MKMKKRFFLTLLMVLPALVWAATWDDYEYKVEDGDAIITGYTGSGGDIVVPDTIDGHSVAIIATEAFRDRALISVVLPNSVEAIGYGAFAGCDKLERVALSENVIYIGQGAFYDCWDLREISSLENVVYIGSEAFSDCALTGVINLGDVECVNYKAFSGCDNLLGVIIGDDASAIEEGAFRECTNLTSVSIGNGVTNIGGLAFYKCTNLVEIEIPNNVIAIGEWAFKDCYSLATCLIGSGVESIGDQAFQACKNLENVVVPHSVTSIGDYSFSYCSRLSHVSISFGVSFIGTEVFTGNSNLVEFVVDSSNGSYCSMDGVLLNKDKTQLVHYPQNRISETYLIPDTVLEINTSAFRGNRNLVCVEINDNLISMGVAAFENCNRLKSITIPDNVISLKGATFRGCASLEDVFIGNGVTNIAVEAFYECRNLKNVMIGDSVALVDDRSFAMCDSLKGLVFPSSVSRIGKWVFTAIKKCYWEGDAPSEYNTFDYAPGSLTNYYLSGTSGWDDEFGGRATALWQTDYVYTINNDTVTITGYTGSMAEIMIPPKIDGFPVIAIGDQAFKSCTGLTRITIPDSVMNVGTAAFWDCSNLTEIIAGTHHPFFSSEDGVLFNKNKTTLIAYPPGKNGEYTLPAGVESIGARAFLNCTEVTKVTIPAEVTVIHDAAFAGCSSLGSIYFLGDAPGIGGSVFNDAPLATVYYLVGTTGWGATLGGCPAALWAWADYYFIVTNNEITITDYHGSGGSITIPDTIEGLPVTAIGGDAFRVCTSLTDVIIPDSVISIGDYAFGACYNLANITIHFGVTLIGEGAFAYCESLMSLVVPASVVSVGDLAFSSCAALAKVYCEGNAPSLGGSSVFNRSPLVTVYYLPETTGWGDTFSGRLTAPWMWKNYTFSVANNEVTITGYTGPGGDITIPGTIEGLPVISIGDRAFYFCTSLVSVTIPDGVVSVGNDAFKECSNLTQITLPESLSTIGYSAFNYCGSLTSITIPVNVISIGSWSFVHCENLTKLYFKGNAPVPGSQMFLSTPAIIYYLPETMGWEDTYSDQPTAPWTWRDYTFTTADNEVTITGYTGSDSDITIPDTIEGDPVTAIAASAFRDCSSLAGVIIPNSVTSLGSFAFRDCASLTNVVFGSNVTSLGSATFFSCTNLTSVTIPDSVTSIGTWAFRNCVSLSHFYCEGDAPGAGTDIFNGSLLVKVYYLTGTTGWGATYGDRPTVLWTWRDFSYTIVHHLGGKGGLPYSTVTITDYIGAGGAVAIPETIEGIRVTIIGDQAFARCNSLTSVIIPDRVTSIGVGAFSLCNGLKNVSIPSRVTSLGNAAFARCLNLKNMCYKGNAPTLGTDVFLDSPITSHYAPGSTGWGLMFGGKPVGQWKPEAHSFGVQDHQFSYTVSGPDELVVIIEMSESLIDPVWTSVSTNTLSGGSSYFSDAQSMNREACYYRFRMP